jgi:hypothetical protein
LASNRPGGRTAGNNAGQAVAVVPGVVGNDARGNGSPAGAIAFVVVGVGINPIIEQAIIGAGLIAAGGAVAIS